MAVAGRFSFLVTPTIPTPKRLNVPSPAMLAPLRKAAVVQTVLRLGNRSRSIVCKLTAIDEGQKAAVPTSVPVRLAHELLQAGHRYLDVRTEDEFNAGHVVGATNIPFMFKVGSGMTKNPNFLEEVSKTFRKDDEILIGCLSGKRSLMAASELLSAGFTGLTDVAGGYSSWVQNNLPIEQ